ncbi:tyrosine-type recombinase/integrase [Micromonospora sp. WMMB235]|uniref:tyrosine-type recombinase/integrase n=1 Tax=Micromonospora sp. WMMB235 TaxID=1172030 RepID=UPI0008DAB660|nr:tyrosine-type recombinase/integrase [Micromonospora sp. WMMB235]OHX04604.1 hypothetical protein BFV98_17210 [Micromonospora sp. WMMB235]
MTGKRRGHGEGSIYQLPDGRFRAAIDLGWSNGKRRRKYVTRRTRAEVVKALKEMTVLAETGRLSTQRVPTLAQWMDTYLSEVASAKVRPSTLHRYREEVEHHIGPMLGRHRLDKLTPGHLTSFYRDRTTVLSVGSVRRMHANLRRALNVAVRWQLIHVNPAALVEPPSLPHVEVRPYSLVEARRFLRAVEGLRLEARWLIGIALGLRQGEVLGLRWDDVDLGSGTLRVRGQLQRNPDTGDLVFVETKTARSRRTLPLPPTVLEALRRHQERQAAERFDADSWADPALVFATAVGTPIHPRNDYRSFREIIRRAGLRQVRLHDLRHTAASVLLAQGVPARVVMEILGHSQISVTLNIYAHVAPEIAREAASRLEGALWSGE